MRCIGLVLVSVAALQAQQRSSLTTDSGSPFLSIPPASEGLRFETQLPPFEAKDIAGRTWRLEDLRGKLTLIYIWYTFEAPGIDAHNTGVPVVSPRPSSPSDKERIY